MMQEKQEKDGVKKRKVAPEKKISAQVALQKRFRGWYGNKKNKYNVESLALSRESSLERLEHTRREEYSYMTN
jgi:hypothetical protein